MTTVRANEKSPHKPGGAERDGAHLDSGFKMDIVTEQDLGLNMNNDSLNYFDPGLTPVEFDEHPDDVFDVQN